MIKRKRIIIPRNQQGFRYDPSTSKNGTKTMKALKKGFKLTALTNKKASCFCLLALFVDPLFWSSGGKKGTNFKPFRQGFG